MSRILSATTITSITIRSNVGRRHRWRIGRIRAFIVSCVMGFIRWIGRGRSNGWTRVASGNDVGHVLCSTYDYDGMRRSNREDRPLCC
jgi:hypothetical protein